MAWHRGVRRVWYGVAAENISRRGVKVISKRQQRHQRQPGDISMAADEA